MIRHLLLLACTLVVPVSASTAASDAQAFDFGTLDYRITFGGDDIAWREFAFYVMPGDTLPLEVHVNGDSEVEISHDGGRLDMQSTHQGVWTAPGQSGLYTLTIQPQGRESMRLNVLVKVPLVADEIEELDGYRIGRYPDQALRGNPIYLPPHGLVEVTPELIDLKISPHFTLGQFLCKQQPDHWPKYLVLREALVAKLEIILAEVNRRGIRADSFVVMSGYRTPWYNQAIGNGQYSRHQWGGAADIYIDTNGDGRMDDLNGDGRSGLRDARLLLGIIEDLYQVSEYAHLHGGLGLYGPRSHRGAFVHVDARGHEARWELP
ncbi:hypothetical protein IC757_13595 [Wenzhouxiangella sp. AB-CW3]|uniref:hypothetical protein n=1 Tax=Wenzhouxiangella sp. AB-CW3 TaxID=2771012 RepID=UPI00168AEAE5|nr:hypothetical protein [Wenzhouxiangella sp. AB-CW3]QOC22047.1 hypothetical protein IC757_13595 [Wenzhouxiangella sp. AB-CW3]